MAYTIKARMTQPPEGRADGYGIDHNIFVRIIDGDNDDPVLHLSCPIPLDEYKELLEVGSAARTALYRQLIIDWYGTIAVPIPAPQPPSGLSDLAAIDDYWDAKKAYDAQKESDVAECATLASQATTWIELLATFDGWEGGFDFTLQEG